MRAGIDSAITDLLARDGVTTAMLVRLDFNTETVFLWTGASNLLVTGTGDSRLDGNTFSPVAAGNVVDISDNAFSYTGSEPMTVSLSIPASPHAAVASASNFPQEYQGLPATFWRALLEEAALPGVPAQWRFRRVRAGTMDDLSIRHSGEAHTFSITVEAHAARISQASGRTYLDQKSFDPTDTSQDYAVAIANGKPAPSSSTAGGTPTPGGGMPNPDGQYEQLK